jgi:hypothetical protein
MHSFSHRNTARQNAGRLNAAIEQRTPEQLALIERIRTACDQRARKGYAGSRAIEIMGSFIQQINWGRKLTEKQVALAESLIRESEVIAPRVTHGQRG